MMPMPGRMNHRRALRRRARRLAQRRAMRVLFVATALFGCSLLAAVEAVAGDEALAPSPGLPLRTRVELFKGSDAWEEVRLERPFRPQETALLICDMWDRHWCPSATSRCDALARKMAPLVDAARAAGVRIVHAPSETMDFYRDTPARQRALRLSRVAPPAERAINEPPLPIDDSDGGCDDDPPPASFRAWSRQHAAIAIDDEDLISDDGHLVYSHLAQQGIRTLLVMGVHTNMCVLGRSFGIRQMTRWGIDCILVRDLTDTMYDPKDPPYVSHDEGTELVVRHIEKYWCPSTTADELRATLEGGR